MTTGTTVTTGTAGITVTTGKAVSTITSGNRDNSDCRLKTLRHLVAALRTVALVRPRGSDCRTYSGFSKILTTFPLM